MATLTFDFDEKRVQEAGYTLEQIMDPIRKWMKEHKIQEVAQCKFEASDDKAIILTSLVVEITKRNHDFINLLKSWILEDEGETEDCIAETKKWYRKKGIPFAE